MADRGRSKRFFRQCCNEGISTRDEREAASVKFPLDLTLLEKRHMEQAYAAIGRAVIAMQMFEIVFVSIHEGFKMVTDPAYLKATGGMIEPEKYKTATANVVKVLSKRGQIATDLEDRLNSLIDRRNELMHRWVLHKGWPATDDNDPASYAGVMELAEWVRIEANAITQLMIGYMLKQLHPDEHEKDPEAYANAMAELFHKLHLKR
jgi:hypothetical protein